MIKYKEKLFNSTTQWIHVEDPSHDEIEFIHNKYKIPLDFITDSFDPYEVARSEFLEKDNDHPFNPHTTAHNNKMHDILIESYQAEQMARTRSSLSEHLSSLFENVIANNLNTIMKVLTSLTIIMTIPTIIGGLWGMNVPLPLQDHPYGFPILLILSVIICVLTYFWLKKNDFI